MNEILVRALTGAVYVALTLAAAWAGAFTTALLFLPVCLLAADEFHRLYWSDDAGPPRFWSALVAGAVYIAVAFFQRFGPGRPEWIVALLLLLAVISTAWMLFNGTPEVGRSLGGVLLLMFLVAFPFALLPHFFTFGNDGIGPELLIGFFLLLWTNETGAYLSGRAFGRHKLLPKVSPKKTWEGVIGGVLLTLAVAYLLWRGWPVLTLREWLAAGAIIAVTSTIGDLLESAMKRSRGIKDSGQLLPGHGGILDRFDGFVLAAPALFVYLLLAR